MVMDTTTNTSPNRNETMEIRDPEGSLTGVLFDNYFVQEADEERPHGKATRVTSPNGAVYVFAHPFGDIIRHDGPADVYPPHVADFVLSIVRYKIAS